MERGGPELVFDLALLGKYKESKAFTEFALTITNPSMSGQVMQLRTLCPS